jgi:glycosyltransferase involved in cell wall biosynthesis
VKVLFVYKYLTLGGVEAVLRARLEALPAMRVEADAWFLHDLGGRSLFGGVAERVSVGSAEACVRSAAAGAVDLLVSIDTEEVLPPLRFARLPWVLECHSGYVENLAYLDRVAAARPRAVLVPSAEQRRLIAPRLPPGVPLRVVPNALAAEFVAPLGRCPAPPARPVLLWIGRLDALKNWPAFLSLGARLGATGPLDLWLVGHPAGEAGPRELLERARAEGVLGNLRWISGLPHARMPALFDAVRESGGIVVSTSRRESFGLAIVEAMARGCAVLVPDQAPFRDLMPHAACRYRSGSVADAARLGRELLANADLRASVGGLGRSSALERCAPDVALAALARELRHALDGR